MLKNKKILLMILLVLLLIFLPNMVKAAVEYTRTIPANEGTIKINFTGLALDEAKEYEFALVRQGGTPTDWFNINDGYTTTNASVTLSGSNDKVVEVLERTNIGFIYIREKVSKKNILENYKVDLKLPYLKAIVYYKNGTEYRINRTYPNCGEGYPWDGAYYKIEKILDSKLIETFLQNNKKTEALENLLPEPPDAGFRSDSGFETKNYNDGLYIIWVKLKPQDNYAKTITGAIIHDGLPNATTLKEYGVAESSVGLTGISLPSTKQITLGKTITLTPSFNPSNATNKIVTWSSSDETVATVDNAGKVTGKKIGSAIITVTSQEGNKKATCTVTVVNEGTEPKVDDKNTENENKAKDFEKHRYEVIEKELTWKEAKAYCEKLGGHLVTITSKEEQEYIEKLISKYNNKEIRFWMGATDEEKEGVWKWITGEEFSYTNWGKNEPDNKFGDQNYMLMHGYKLAYYGIEIGQWDDVSNNDSTATTYFICEWDDEKINNNNNEPINTKKDDDDDSIAKGTMPYTGGTFFVILAVLGIASVAIYVYKRNNDLKGI